MGPANRGFFFSDFGLELLWVSHPAEAQSEDSRSAAGMAPPWVYGSDGVLVLYSWSDSGNPDCQTESGHSNPG
jgi:hypothetical protein